MAIVKMKKLRLIGLRAECAGLLQELSLLGCVEISETCADGENALLSPMRREGEDWKSVKSRLESAFDLLKKYDAVKQGLFTVRDEVKSADFFSDALIPDALGAADAIAGLQGRVASIQSALAGQEAKRLSLLPWRGLDIDPCWEGTEHTTALRGTTPPAATGLTLREAAGDAACEIFPISESKEQKCWLVIALREDADRLRQALREAGFAQAPAIAPGLPAASIADAEKRLEEIRGELAKAKAGFAAFSDRGPLLRLAIDRAAQEVQKQEAAERLLCTEKAFALEGWVPEPEEKRLAEALGRYACAWETAEPAPEEIPEVPIKLKNSRLVEPMTMVTEMYSLPAYDGIDPNPLIMPFFSVFFGIMYGDIGYGLILLAAGLFARLKLKPKGTMGYMAGLLIMCGVTTVGAGVLFGSFFGDAVPVVTEMLGLGRLELWKLLDPMTDPLTMLIASMAIGVFQILFGMGVKAYMLIRDGKPLDALMDVGSWWLLFAGIALGALGKGWYVALAGVAALVLTQGRAKPTLIGKAIGGVASLYDATSYLGDILSYARLMALVLATSVFGSVVNMLGSMLGPIGFIPVFLAGHGFCMAINLIGTYVHAARLQYLEFFGKFYKDGGRRFDPLAVNTKYVDIV